MVSSKATTVEQYLDELEPSRRPDVEAVRDVVNTHMPDGVIEQMMWGMIGWTVDPDVSGPTENGQPIHVAALAAQKHKISLYMSAIYTDPATSAEFERAWVEEVGSIDRGQSCVRFKTAEKAGLQAVATVLDQLDIEDLMGRMEAPG